jgi:hypothetical protein
MPKTPTTKSNADRDAEFAQIFAGVAPDTTSASTIKARLKEYRPQILAMREQGYSDALIVQRIKLPPVSIETTERNLRKVLAKHRRAKRKETTKKTAATPQAATK